MTEEEIYSSKLFNILKRIVKNEHPWIIDIKLDTDPNEYSVTVFVNLIINAETLSKMYGFTFPSWKTYQKNIMYLSSLPLNPSKELKDELDELQKELNQIVESISRNSHIPIEYRNVLKKDGKEGDSPYDFKIFAISKFLLRYDEQ